MIRADEVRARLSDAAERAARELEARVDAALEASAEDGAWPCRVDLPQKIDGAVVRIVLARYRDPQAAGEDASCAPQDRGEP